MWSGRGGLAVREVAGPAEVLDEGAAGDFLAVPAGVGGGVGVRSVRKRPDGV